jgi:hypothetical protein
MDLCAIYLNENKRNKITEKSKEGIQTSWGGGIRSWTVFSSKICIFNLRYINRKHFVQKICQIKK